MPTDPTRPLERFRRRRRQQGFVRVEVQVRAEDAELLRSVARRLADPQGDPSARAWLRERFATVPEGGLKALLTAALPDGRDGHDEPAEIDELDVKRSPDLPRDVDL
jgi:hypothetical protein